MQAQLQFVRCALERASSDPSTSLDELRHRQLPWLCLKSSSKPNFQSRVSLVEVPACGRNHLVLHWTSELKQGRALMGTQMPLIADGSKCIFHFVHSWTLMELVSISWISTLKTKPRLAFEFWNRKCVFTRFVKVCVCYS